MSPITITNSGTITIGNIHNTHNLNTGTITINGNNSGNITINNNWNNINMPGLMQLVAYGARDVYMTENLYAEEISPRWWGEREKLVDKLKTEKVCEDDCLIC